MRGEKKKEEGIRDGTHERDGQKPIGKTNLTSEPALLQLGKNLFVVVGVCCLKEGGGRFCKTTHVGIVLAGVKEWKTIKCAQKKPGEKKEKQESISSVLTRQRNPGADCLKTRKRKIET